MDQRAYMLALGITVVLARELGVRTAVATLLSALLASNFRCKETQLDAGPPKPKRLRHGDEGAAPREAGMTSAEVARATGRSPSMIRRHLAKLGIEAHLTVAPGRNARLIPARFLPELLHSIAKAPLPRTGPGTRC